MMHILALIDHPLLSLCGWVVNYNIALQTRHEYLPGLSLPQSSLLLTYVADSRVPWVLHRPSQRY